MQVSKENPGEENPFASPPPPSPQWRLRIKTFCTRGVSILLENNNESKKIETSLKSFGLFFLYIIDRRLNTSYDLP